MNLNNDDERIFQILKNYKEHNLTYSEIERFLNLLTDVTYVKKFVDSKFKELVKEAKKEDEKFLETIILGINEKDYIIKFIDSFEDKEFVGKLVRKAIRKPELELDIFEKMKLLFNHALFAKDITMFFRINKVPSKLIIKFLEEQEKKTEDWRLKAFTLLTGDKFYIKKKYEEGLFGKGIDEEVIERIDLPRDMTFGMEIEVEGDFAHVLEAIQGMALFKGWECEDEHTLPHGIEIKSPNPKEIEYEITEEDIYIVSNVLKNCGLEATELCGGHIHIGADYLDNSAQAMSNLAELYGNTESIFYMICNEKGEVPRDAVFKWAKPMSGKLEEIVNSGEIELEDEQDLKKFVDSLSRIQQAGCYKTRYTSINFLNLVKGEKNTIEFRALNQPKSPQGWIQNLNLCGGYVRAAKEIADIQNKSVELRTEEENKKLEYFEKIKSTVDDLEKLEYLLELVVSKNSRDIYRERYNTNIELVDEDFFLALKDFMNQGPIIINRREIAKSAFGGEDGIKYKEYESVENRIRIDLSERERA